MPWIKDEVKKTDQATENHILEWVHGCARHQRKTTKRSKTG